MGGAHGRAQCGQPGRSPSELREEEKGHGTLLRDDRSSERR